MRFPSPALGCRASRAVEPVGLSEGGVLLRRDVLSRMLEMYQPQAGSEPRRAFQVRNMNIVDPLMPTNNLGRSVTRANKARVRKALAAGAAVLSGIVDKVCPCAHNPEPWSLEKQPLLHFCRGITTWLVMPACCAYWQAPCSQPL